ARPAGNFPRPAPVLPLCARQPAPIILLAHPLNPGDTAMNEKESLLRNALLKIAELASHAADGSEDGSGEEQPDRAPAGPAPDSEEYGCSVKQLPSRLLVKAAETARQINPVNAPMFGPLAQVGGDFHVMEPMRIAVLTAKYWGPTPRRLTVSFMETTAANL